MLGYLSTTEAENRISAMSHEVIDIDTAWRTCTQPRVEPLVKDTHAAFTEPFAHDAVRAIISQKISNLILLPETDLDGNQLLNEAGMGSMLTAELRIFIHRTFEVDVPFDVLSKKATLNSLTDMIARDLQASA
ncbi:hypothetical protein AtubIFM57258_004547 [Aspergillus tubingensis]|nr:hypothetical protein AtubIFM57258_004547 [Aspergillus tubingensis]